MCTLLWNRLAQVKHWTKEEENRRKRPSPSLLRLSASPSWNVTSPETKMARRDVTVLLWRVFRIAAITVPRSRMLARDTNFLNVTSTASLWNLRLWRSGVKECGHMYELLLDTVHIVMVFYCFFFSGVCARWRYSDTWPTTSGSIT